MDSLSGGGCGAIATTDGRKNENSHSHVNNLSRSAFYAGKKCEQAAAVASVIFSLDLHLQQHVSKRRPNLYDCHFEGGMIKPAPS